MKNAAIIQARMNSNRLPGKVLQDICGQTMLACVLRRVKRASLLDQVIVATSATDADNAIIDECQKLAVPTFRGSEVDVLDRFYHAMLSCGADVAVRITADCPLIEPEIIDKVLRAFLSSNVDYASNTLNRTYPRGLDVEVTKLSALKCAWEQSSKLYHRAHVTPYLYENPQKFKLLSVTNKTDWSCYRWTVDTSDDLEFVRKVYELLGCNDLFNWREALRICNKNPGIVELNRHVEQKALEKS